ncbi:hypothetical protein EJB05_25312 [Eragrostis curvula]|uniref:RRM domain-containing protein n=1 Tax=Eragrostis curvula TaxID=38414 RepID=A0A5J9VBH4_9POAL|nr:hypothetical protein EJB05_25312 [Eragrostis curvula]
MAAAAAAAGGEAEGDGGGSVVRIFVGGLAEGVSAGDLEAVFGSIGRVAGIEFVRTNGRSFAYVDFHCPSDKALAKLFSTYNGCKWKGGKLRLEKAKEHYLTRLKREWEQEAAAAAAAVQEAAAKDNVEKEEKPKLDKAALEGMKINIYFPKLRKVKPLPFKGSGKHKYSFRNIVVPSYPIHFCDCEEHCGPPEAANDEYASVLNAVSYEKERNIMNSVMSKLFEKENEHLDSSEMEKCDVHIDTMEPSNALNSMQMEQEEEAPDEDLEDMQVEETEEPSDEDLDDDLVINIAPRKSNKSIVHAKTEVLQASKDLQARRHPRFEETSQPKKKQRFEGSSEFRKGKQEPTSVIPGARKTGKSLPAIQEASQNQPKSPGLAGKGTSEFSSAIPRDKSPTDPQDVEALTSSTKSESEQKMVSTQPKKGSIWIQKASWRDLVGGMGSTPFSISQVLPNSNPVAPNANESGISEKILEAATQPLSEQMLPSSMGVPSVGTTDVAIGRATGESEENNKAQKVLFSFDDSEMAMMVVVRAIRIFVSVMSKLPYSTIDNVSNGDHPREGPEVYQSKQASPSADEADELEDETLITPEPMSDKIAGRFQRNLGSASWDFYGSVKIVLLKSKLNALIPCGFLAILINYITQDNGWVFPLSLLGIIPLAERLGFATEQLALFTGPTVGGLLNATFGNATELIISIHALRSGKLRVVQQTLLGSIVSNVLLVLGCAFFAGGLSCGKTEQTFSKADAVLNSGLLLMAVMGLLSPAMLHYTNTEVDLGKSALGLSRFSSCGGGKNQAYNEDEGGFPDISKWEAIAWLAIFTVWISVFSNYLVGAIEVASEAWNIPIAFISVVLLPIVGNAAEHACAVTFAMKDNLDISLAVAIGSSTQLSMFVVDTILCTDGMDDGPANGPEFPSVRNCKPFDNSTGCGIFVAVSASFYVYADPNINGKSPGN